MALATSGNLTVIMLSDDESDTLRDAVDYALEHLHREKGAQLNWLYFNLGILRDEVW